MEGYIQEYENESQRNRIENAFSYHVPKNTQTLRYEHIRNYAKEMAYMLTALCPPSRELSLALTHLEEMVMQANASIARNE